MSFDLPMDHQSSLPAPTESDPFVLIDDAHTFGGTQIAFAWTVYVLLHCVNASVICVCTPRTRTAVGSIVGTHPKLSFEDAPAAMPLNLFCFPVRLPAYWRLLKRLQRHGVRAWWLNLPDIEFGLAPLLVLRGLGIVPRGYLHGTARFAAFYRHASWARRWLSRLRDFVADHVLFRLHRVLVTPSEASRHELEARLRRKRRPMTAFLYPPGPLPHITSSERKPCAAQTNTIELWIVGNVVQGHKNQIAALETLAVLRTRGFDARLTVVGTGPDLEALRRRAVSMGVTDCVTWAGWIADPWSATPAGATVLVPSFHETLGLVAREALGHGLRLVVSPLEVFREWVPPTMIARSFAAADLADAVLRVRQAEDVTFAMEARRALERFSHSSFAEGFENLSRLRLDD